jgi:hypothetical protein
MSPRIPDSDPSLSSVMMMNVRRYSFAKQSPANMNVMMVFISLEVV